MNDYWMEVDHVAFCSADSPSVDRDKHFVVETSRGPIVLCAIGNIYYLGGEFGNVKTLLRKGECHPVKELGKISDLEHYSENLKMYYTMSLREEMESIRDDLEDHITSD